MAGYEVRRSDQPPVTVDKPEYAVTGLQCGQSTRLRVVAFDRAQNRSGKATLTVGTTACLDTQPPAAPHGFTQIATTANAVVLGWSPSSDNVGVVEYAVYRNLQRVVTTAEPNATLGGLACGSTYSYLVDAADAAGNRSLQANVYVRTADCNIVTDTTPPTTPTGLAPTSIAPTALALSWNAATDNVGVTGYDVYQQRRQGCIADDDEHEPERPLVRNVLPAQGFRARRRREQLATGEALGIHESMHFVH